MGRHVSSFQDKVNWLVSNPHYWLDWPRGRFNDDQIKRAMMVDGLISPKSHMYDIMDFGKLIAAARSQSRKGV